MMFLKSEVFWEIIIFIPILLFSLIFAMLELLVLIKCIFEGDD